MGTLSSKKGLNLDSDKESEDDEEENSEGENVIKKEDIEYANHDEVIMLADDIAEGINYYQRKP
jgi:hypothetical protein